MLSTLRSLTLITRFVISVFPAVSRELKGWRFKAGCAPDQELAAQALASIQHKKFHCQGGSIYSLYPQVDRASLVRLIVALQTISDYLDNLCDRAGIFDEQAFRQLHLAIAEALDPERPVSNYYAYYPLKADGGYLAALVEACRLEVCRLPSYDKVKTHTLRFGYLYSELQTYKHLHPSVREDKMLTWINTHLPDYPGIGPWEFAAATGSTLGMFMLCAAASNPRLSKEEASAIQQAYFPYITGLHILLDYFIDAAEDRQHGDLNFVFYYPHEQEISSRLSWFTARALKAAENLSEPVFHQSVIEGLLAMYLSDPKTNQGCEKRTKKVLLKKGGPYTKLLYSICRGLRMSNIL